MPVAVQVVTEHRVIFIRGWGTVTEADLQAARRAANNDERAKVGFDRVWGSTAAPWPAGA